ncbi:MAG TPA: hypothetical protein VK034_10735 [Enhygromyxa sp.]|nr:hypothetical protein [Enhygromyxa sp.]
MMFLHIVTLSIIGWAEAPTETTTATTEQPQLFALDSSSVASDDAPSSPKWLASPPEEDDIIDNCDGGTCCWPLPGDLYVCCHADHGCIVL